MHSIEVVPVEREAVQGRGGDSGQRDATLLSVDGCAGEQKMSACLVTAR